MVKKTHYGLYWKGIGVQIEYGGEFQSSRYDLCFCSTCLLPDVPRWQITSTRSLSTTWLQNFCLSDSNQLKSCDLSSWDESWSIRHSPQPNSTPVFLDYSFFLVTSPQIQHHYVSILVELAQKPLDLINEQFNVIPAISGYHVKCMQMSTHIYEALTNSSCIWESAACGLPNFSSSLFDSSTIRTKNYFWPLYSDLSRNGESIYSNSIQPLDENSSNNPFSHESLTNPTIVGSYSSEQVLTSTPRKTRKHRLLRVKVLTILPHS